MVENQGIIKDLANREGQQEIAKAISNFGALRNALRAEAAAAVSERMSNRSYYWACESERYADIAKTQADRAQEYSGIAQQKAAEAAQSANLADGYATRSMEWAVKMDGKVGGLDYSSKYYANQASSVLARALKIPQDVQNFNTVVPIEAGKSIRVNRAGTGFEAFVPGEGSATQQEETTPQPVEVDLSNCMQLDTENDVWNANSKRISGVSTPSEGTDAANKDYVDRIQVTAQSGSKILYMDSTSLLTDELVVEEGQIIKTAGYYYAGDGGGATYQCKWIPDSGVSGYPWAFKLGLSTEIEYKIQYRADGTPLRDASGNYVFVLDNNNRQIPVTDDNGLPKYKRMYACIDEKVVNYRMFGAKLDGIENDDEALENTHLYQRSCYYIEKMSERYHYYVKVENHEGIIKKSNNNPIICAGDIDLSGSQLIIQDCNATWFGFYLWGDNEISYFTYEPVAAAKTTYVRDNFVINTLGNEGDLKQNCVLFLKEEPYAVRDDANYMYSEPRYELLLHTSDGVLSHPFTEDWDKAGGEQISAILSDYKTHEVHTDTMISHFTISYTKLSSTHYYFKGCEVKLETQADSYCSVLWCKCHNAHISGFTFHVDPTQLHNTSFKNTMIYVWGSYNVEVSDIVGFNAAGKKVGGTNGTSGYVLRATNCLNLRFHDISVQGYWGATAMNCVKDVHVERVNINRLDIHNYFYNLYIDKCNMYNHSIQIGEGRGICQITNTNFYVNGLEGDSWPNAHLLEFNLTYGRIFEGKVYVENCNVFLKSPDANEFDVMKIEFFPEAVSTLTHYKFPDVTIKDCYFHSYDADTYLVYFMIAGKRRCTTSTKAPSNILNYCRDTGNDNTGNLFWKYLGRGVDWIDNGDDSRYDVQPGTIIRTFEKYLDSENKTVFHSFKHFLVVSAGTIPVPSENNKPNNTTGNNFTCGTATIKYVDNLEWQANKTYSAGDYCFTSSSGWLPVFCYECITGGHSNGYRPVHTSGEVIDGVTVDPYEKDSCWWKYVGTFDSFFTAGTFSPNKHVSNDQYLFADGRIYKVTMDGNLGTNPPVNTNWNGSFYEGTTQLSFRGKVWAPKTWWSEGCYCISEVNGNKYVYQLVRHPGTTSGEIPVPGNSLSVDGDIIWEYTTDTATKQWAAQTQFYEGDVVSTTAGNKYKCIFDGRLELPYQINIENIYCNPNMVAGDVFAWYAPGDSTDVPTKLGGKSAWKVKITNVDLYRFRDQNCTYFCHEGNVAPTIVEGTGGGAGTPGAPGKSAYQYARDGGYTGTEAQFATALNNALTITNGDEVAY